MKTESGIRITGLVIGLMLFILILLFLSALFSGGNGPNKDNTKTYPPQTPVPPDNHLRNQRAPPGGTVTSHRTGISAGSRASGDNTIFIPALNPVVTSESIVLSPESAQNYLGELHTVTARLQDDTGKPLAGRDVVFQIISGSNAEVNLVTVSL